MVDNLPCNAADVADWFPDAPPDAHDLMRRCRQFQHMLVQDKLSFGTGIG